MENLTYRERNAIEELHTRMKNELSSPHLKEDASLFYRFLKARDFNIDKAEIMLKKHIFWRKAFQIDKILDIFKPKEFFEYVEPSLIGFDKEGDVVKYLATGRINSGEVFKCVKMNDYMKHWFWFAEKNESLVIQQSKRTGKMTTVSYVMDLDKLEFSNATSKTSAEMMIRFTNLLQENYPERLKSLYIINAPSYYVVIYTIVKAVMSNAMISKINVFGDSGWKEKLLEVIDADVLPEFLGGNRTDPDGDPYCKSFITRPGKIPQKYYLTEAERYFEDPSKVDSLTIRPSEKKEISVYVKEKDSLIKWKFLVRSKTIRFGLFLKESSREMKEILPLYEYNTSDGTEENSYKCHSAGEYIIIFDNNHSRFNGKEVQYIISVEKLEDSSAVLK